MNLYREIFQHWSQKDSERGIVKYFIAEDNAHAYDVVYSEWCSQYEDHTRDNYDPDEFEPEYEDTPEQAKQRVIDECGDINVTDRFENVFNDLYYGLTLKGWELVKEDLTLLDVTSLIKLNVLETE